MAGSVFRAFSSGKTGYTNTDNIGNAVGTGVGIISGLNSPKTTQCVEITQGSVYVLTLQAPVTLPATVLQSTSSTQTPATTTPTAAPTTPPAQSQKTPNS